MTTYTVKPGQSISVIAAKLGLKPQDIIDLNGDLLKGNPNFIKPGWKLRLPTDANIGDQSASSFQKSGPKRPEIYIQPNGVPTLTPQGDPDRHPATATDSPEENSLRWKLDALQRDYDCLHTDNERAGIYQKMQQVQARISEIVMQKLEEGGAARKNPETGKLELTEEVAMQLNQKLASWTA
jgi:LysM repeat protein